MKAITRIEQSLAMALAAAEDASCPPKLASAVRHAVFPGGARIRHRRLDRGAHRLARVRDRQPDLSGQQPRRRRAAQDAQRALLCALCSGGEAQGAGEPAHGGRALRSGSSLAAFAAPASARNRDFQGTCPCRVTLFWKSSAG